MLEMCAAVDKVIAPKSCILVGGGGAKALAYFTTVRERTNQSILVGRFVRSSYARTILLSDLLADRVHKHLDIGVHYVNQAVPCDTLVAFRRLFSGIPIQHLLDRSIQ